MTAADLDALAVRASRAGHESIAQYALALEKALHPDGYELVRVNSKGVQQLIDDDSHPVVVVRLERLPDGTCDMWFRVPE